MRYGQAAIFQSRYKLSLSVRSFVFGCVAQNVGYGIGDPLAESLDNLSAGDCAVGYPVSSVLPHQYAVGKIIWREIKQQTVAFGRSGDSAVLYRDEALAHKTFECRAVFVYGVAVRHIRVRSVCGQRRISGEVGKCLNKAV